MHPAIFLDRDGVIIENRSTYVRSWADVSIYPNALTALARLSDSQYKIVIVTNQSVVGRGIISLKIAQSINKRLVKEISCAGGRVDKVFMCPHAPESGCHCRKPKPGLLLQACREYSIDLSRSVMIGDALTDIKAGQIAGVSRTTLVLTGMGLEQARLPEAAHIRPFSTFNTLADALAEIS